MRTANSLGGPYSSFAGHDASRALALFQTEMVKEEYDDLSDLTAQQMESVKEWEEQLGGKDIKTVTAILIHSRSRYTFYFCL